uniref:hydroxyethylthiazole kinase n=1 Tax=Philodina roseola TaxID=96448 RepID=G3KGX2_PHIRO|nr:hydroxyethylthiazole kinase [Philodina roseola]
MNNSLTLTNQTAMSTEELKIAVGEAFDAIRAKRPMIHQITNYVVMNQTANATLHIGASPVMAHAVDEVEEMVSLANALVINTGTLSRHWIEGMHLAGKRANQQVIPIVLDPVGVGATNFRTETILKLLDSLDIAIIKGNSGEIGKLNSETVQVRGVDSIMGTNVPCQTVLELSRKRDGKTIVALSGKIDYVSDGRQVIMIKNECDLLNQLTGMGCTVSAIMGCFAGITDNYLLAAVGGFAVMGVCAELAAKDSRVRGAASFQVALFDRLSTLTGTELANLLDIEIVNC